MSAQRNSQNGKMKAPEHFDPAPVNATEDTPVQTNVKTFIAVISGCVIAAIFWSTLSIKVGAESNKLGAVETVTYSTKEKVQVQGFEIKNIDTRVTSLEEWRKEMLQQRDDIKAIRAMLEEQARKERKP
jgi:hypothetical protein